MMLHHVTVKLRAEANVNFHFQGHCVFRKLLDTQALLIDAKNACYHKIFNKFDNKQETMEDIRMAAKASSNGEKVIHDIFNLLQDCMIVGEVITTIFPLSPLPYFLLPPSFLSLRSALPSSPLSPLPSPFCPLPSPLFPLPSPLSPLPSPFSPLRSAVFPSSRHPLFQDHVLEMGRGASFLQTPPGCRVQDQHTDFDMLNLRALGRRRGAHSCFLCVLGVRSPPLMQKEAMLNLGCSATQLRPIY